MLGIEQQYEKDVKDNKGDWIDVVRVRVRMNFNISNLT
jgi:hypothetical protein